MRSKIEVTERHIHTFHHMCINIVSGARRTGLTMLALFPKRNCTFMKVHIKNTKLLRTPQCVSEWVSDILLGISLLIPFHATSTHYTPAAGGIKIILYHDTWERWSDGWFNWNSIKEVVNPFSGEKYIYVYRPISVPRVEFL